MKFWDDMRKKIALTDNDKLMIGNAVSNDVEYTDLSRIKAYVGEQSDIRPKNNLFTGSNVFDGDVFFLQQVVFDGMEAPSSSTAPESPQDLVRLVDVEVMIGQAIADTFIYADTEDISDLAWL
ncbi:MAG: hypothetical protein BGO29_14765 [Bacteroidales bacterium 36-12]|nr:MAG: hypothetical protein BGO29_14765 [Bacteroidales bacterium 36-12]